MGEQKAHFVGYRSFMSKAGKQCNILMFLIIPTPSKDNSYCNAEITNIFVDSDIYNTIINSKKIMDIVPVKYSVSGSRVYYSL